MFFILSVFVLVHSAEGDSVRAYKNQSQETILSSLASEGKTGEFISQKTYETFIESKRPTHKPDPAREQLVIDAKDKTKKTEDRLDALIQAINLK